MDDMALAERVAAALLDCALCVHCLGIKTFATAAQIMDVLPAVRNAVTLRVEALAPCHACGSRRSVTYSFAGPRA